MPLPALLRRLPALALLCAGTASAQVPVPPAPPSPAASAPATPADAAAARAQRVEITGGRESDADLRRQSTAAKIVIGRDEIDKFGDATLGEVLRRLPGVTTPGAPGRGGAPRLRGLGSGYTQLLIDGQRFPPGFSLESLTPEQVERIEILRAPTAETGARAIAGTINIVTREGFRRRLDDLRLSAGVENGEFTPGLFWTHNDSAGPLTYNVSAGSFANRRRSTSETLTTQAEIDDGTLVGHETLASEARDRRQGLNLSGRLQWRLGEPGDLLLLQPSVFHSESEGQRASTVNQTLPGPPALPMYDLAEGSAGGRFTSARLNGQWRQRLEGGARIELNGGAGSWRSRNASERREYRTGASAPLRVTEDTSDARERSANLGLKLTQLLGADAGAGHSFVTGAEIETVRRDDRRSSLQDGVPLLTDFGDELQASTQRLAAYAQDEWSLGAHWALHAGLRWEGIRTRGDAGDGTRPGNRSSVWTPLVHLLWKPDPAKRDQLRLSLTRSYRTPGVAQLIARPAINPRFPASGGNEPTSPDSAGNPALQPELASGVDFAYERYLEDGGVLSANLFARRIALVMRNVVALETVSYSPVPRWVSRPQNIGDAATAGIELEAKVRLDQLVDGAPRVELRHNLAFYRSRVDGVPGPDNRLDGQSPASANLGADYRLRSLPLTLGGNLNWVPGYRSQLAADRAASVSRKTVWDGYALWAVTPAVGLRLLASNLAPRDYASSSSFETTMLRETSVTSGPSYTNWQLRLELKL